MPKYNYISKLKETLSSKETENLDLKNQITILENKIIELENKVKQYKQKIKGLC